MRGCRKAGIHFLPVGWNTSSCFPAASLCSAFHTPCLSSSSASLSCPLLFLATFFFLCSIYLGCYSLIHPHLYYLYAIPFLLLFALKIFYFLKKYPYEFLFLLFWNYLLCNFFQLPCHYYHPPYLCIKPYVAPRTQNSKGNPNIASLFLLHIFLHDD